MLITMEYIDMPIIDTYIMLRFMRRLTFMTMRCIKLLHTSYLVCNFFIDKKDLINLLLTPLFIRLLSKPRFLWIFKNLNPNTYKGLFLVWKEIYYIKTNNKKPLYPEWLLSLKSTKTAYAFGGKQLAKCLAGSVSYALMASSTVMPNALATPIP
ncbi:Uncharacterised protein [Moraxella lacunata]|uniref:Uncharacterized protein n=1 Tax=Moraxella lacunata TaxID=477 RepID=A0A378QM14_MORLA|nr:Uncharacterised protein [Moraxella lacunata]